MPALYSFSKLTIGNLFRLGWHPTVEGAENIPAHGGAILAGNHLSVSDELLLGMTVSRHIAFWAKTEYFSGSGFRGWVSRAMVRGVGAIPVARQGGRAVLAAFDAAIPILRDGGLVAVYPEGTRSPDGRLYRGHTGAIRLAQAAGVPIIPVGTIGTDKVQPIGARIPHLSGHVTIRFGQPIDVASRSGDAATIRSATDELMAAIQGLTGQEYVPSYAKRQRPALV